MQVIFFGSVLTSLSTEVLISEGGSSFSSWTLFSCEHGTGPINSGITVGSSIVLGSSIGAVAGLGCELDDSSSILYITNSDVD